MIGEGKYTAVATRMQYEDGEFLLRKGKSQNGTPRVLVFFKILDGQHMGEKYPWYGYCGTAETKERTFKSLRFCGLKGASPRLEDANDQAMNQKVEVVIEHNEWKGKVSPRISWVNKLGASISMMHKPMSAEDDQRFEMQMQSVACQVPEESGEIVDQNTDDSTVVIQQAFPDAEIADDDIPF